jgi:hypothetical protein
MAGDPKARTMTVPYEGGSFTASKELIRHIFGDKFVDEQVPKTVDRKRKEHNRTRVIGGPSIVVKEANYKETKFPVAKGHSRSGGDPVLFLVGNDAFTARLHGNHQNFVKFVRANKAQLQKTFQVRTEKNSLYGPFKTLLDTFVGGNP